MRYNSDNKGFRCYDETGSSKILDANTCLIFFLQLVPVPLKLMPNMSFQVVELRGQVVSGQTERNDLWEMNHLII